MFAEINIVDANNNNIRDGQQMWLEGPEGGRIKIMAKVTQEGVHPASCGCLSTLPDISKARTCVTSTQRAVIPYVLGEACNTALTYGYDSVTQMQETKCSLCRITPLEGD